MTSFAISTTYTARFARCSSQFSRPFAIDAAHRQVFIDDVFLDPFLMGLTEAEEKLVEDAMLMEKGEKLRGATRRARNSVFLVVNEAP